LNRLALAAVLLAAGCAPYQQMTNTWTRTPAATLPMEQARAECRLLTMQDPRSNDWYAVRAGSPTVAPDGTLIALSDWGMAVMDQCMRTKGYLVGPMVPYPG
jgi:uncharacterized lipoprotein YajG